MFTRDPNNRMTRNDNKNEILLELDLQSIYKGSI